MRWRKRERKYSLILILPPHINRMHSCESASYITNRLTILSTKYQCLLHCMFKLSPSIISIWGQQNLLSYFHGSMDNVLESFLYFLGLLSSVLQSLATCGYLNLLKWNTIKLEFSFNYSPLYWPHFQCSESTWGWRLCYWLGAADREYSHHPRKFYWSALAG